eukprot:PhM_4_TR8448/c0_g1_i1/m.51384
MHTSMSTVNSNCNVVTTFSGASLELIESLRHNYAKKFKSMSGWVDEVADRRVEVDVEAIVNAHSIAENEINPLYYACRGNDLEAVQKLVSLGAKVNLPYPRHHKGTFSSALHIAMYNFNIDIVTYLRRLGGDLCARNSERDLPVHDARSLGGRFATKHPRPQHHALTTKLGVSIIDEQSLLSVYDNKVRLFCQLQTLTVDEKKELETLLRQHPSYATAQFGRGHWAPLHVACATGNAEALDALLHCTEIDYKVVCVRDDDGWTPLHCLAARAIVKGPSEGEKLLAMARSIIQRCPETLCQICGSNTSDALQHRILNRMWLGTVAGSTYRLYTYGVEQCDEPNVERFGGWLWIDDGRRVDVLVTFYPTKQRKIAVTSRGTTVREVNYLPNYFVDEIHSMIRPSDASWDLVPPRDGDDGLKEVPTLLPCCVDKYANIQWNIAGTRVFHWRFLNIVSGKERFEVQNAEKPDEMLTVTLSKSWSENGGYVVEMGTKTIDYEHLRGTYEGCCTDIAPATLPRGGSVISWVVESNLTSWFDLFLDGCISNIPIIENDVLCSALRIFASLNTESRKQIEAFLRKIGAVRDVMSAKRSYRPANSEEGPALITLCVAKDAKAARSLFRDLNFIPEGTSSEIAIVRENELLDLLHNACAVGSRRDVERVLQLMRTYQEWNNGDVLSHALRVEGGVSTIDQYAVSVAAAFGHLNILNLLLSNGADMMAGEGLALRRAIQNGHWEAAKWLVDKCWTGKLHSYPTLEITGEGGVARPVPLEEVRFCHNNNLLTSTYEEDYICSSVRWQNDDDGDSGDTTTEALHSKTALMVIDMQLDFFSDVNNAGLPCAGATTEMAERAAKFIRSVSPFISCIFVAMDWHPPGHFSFATSHKNKNRYETIIDPRNGMVQVLWPEHCIENKPNTCVHPIVQKALDETGKELVVVYSGTNPQVDSYSAFYDNNKSVKSAMHNELLKRDIEDVYMFGIATDYCVAYSALDALTLGFDVVVIEDLCAAVDKMGGVAKLDMINKRGGQVMTAKQVQRLLEINNGTTKAKDTARYSFYNTRVLRELFALRTIRYYMLFDANINSAKLLKRLNTFDFGSSNPREGELFLYMSALLCTRRELFRFRIHGLWFQNFEPFDEPQALKYPLHYLMMLAKYAHSSVNGSNALELLTSVIRFINENHDDPIDDRGQERHRFPLPGMESSKSLLDFARDTPQMCHSMDPVACHCLFHMCVTKSSVRRPAAHPLLSLDLHDLEKFDHVPMVTSRPTRRVCAVGLSYHNSSVNKNAGLVTDGPSSPPRREFEHLLSCTPLMLAVRLRLTKAVQAMLICSSDRPPIVWDEEEVNGKDVMGDRFTFSSFSDLWHAVPEAKNRDGTIALASTPAFHYLLRSTRSLAEDTTEIVFDDYHIVASPECDEYIPLQTAPPGITPISSHTFHAGCGSRRQPFETIISKANDENKKLEERLLEELNSHGHTRLSYIEDFEDQLNDRHDDDNDDDTPNWDSPCGLQWLCPECGAYIHDCYEVPKPVLLKLKLRTLTDAVESLAIARIFLQACTLYERPLFVNGEPRDHVTVDDMSVSRYVDLSGLYYWSGAFFSTRTNTYFRGDTGLALLFQHMPDLIPQLHLLNVLNKCPLTSYREINDMVQSSTCSILIRRRHLWKVT